VRYAQIAEGVGKAFEKGDPEHAADYRKNTAALVEQLDELHTEFRQGLAHTKSKVFITTHAAFGYLAERYGLTEEAINGLDPESEPSAARVKELEKMARADGVTTVFYETLVSDKTAKTIAKDAHLKTDVLDPIEGITDESRGTDYFSVQRANLKALQQALGAR
jgi:zinc transport system substrate-binding protein